MMEHWNIGLTKKILDFPLFRHSTIPLFQNYPLTGTCPASPAL